MKVKVCSVVRLMYDVCTCPRFTGDADEGCRKHRYPQRGAAPRERKPVLNWQVPVTGCVTSPCVISLPVTQFIFASQHLILLLDETLRPDTLSTHQIVFGCYSLWKTVGCKWTYFLYRSLEFGPLQYSNIKHFKRGLFILGPTSNKIKKGLFDF